MTDLLRYPLSLVALGLRRIIGCRHPHTLRVKREGRWFLSCHACGYLAEMNPASRGEKLLRYQVADSGQK